MSGNVLNIFVIETELQYLAFKAINEFIDVNLTLIFTTSERVHQRLSCEKHICIFTNRESRGWIGRLNTIRSNLEIYKYQIQKLSNDYSQINFHTPRIDNVYNNLAINYLKFHFPCVNINVRLIPDGAINIFSSNLSASQIAKQKRWEANIGFKLFKDLKYYHYSGDELGADADIVDRIYCFKGVQTGYDERKLQKISLPISYASKNKTGNSILVVGQNFLQLKTASEEYVEKVSEAIYRLVNTITAERVDYAPHPRSRFNEFGRKEYNFIDPDYLCIEEVIAKGDYKHIISCYSSALINSKIILGRDINTYSLGLDQFPFKDISQKKKLVTAYKNLEIQVLSLGK